MSSNACFLLCVRSFCHLKQTLTEICFCCLFWFSLTRATILFASHSDCDEIPANCSLKDVFCLPVCVALQNNPAPSERNKSISKSRESSARGLVT